MTSRRAFFRSLWAVPAVMAMPTAPASPDAQLPVLVNVQVSQRTITEAVLRELATNRNDALTRMKRLL